jgi:hypothetical protein
MNNPERQTNFGFKPETEPPVDHEDLIDNPEIEPNMTDEDFKEFMRKGAADPAKTKREILAKRRYLDKTGKEWPKEKPPQ